MNGNFLFTKNTKLPYGTENPGKITSYDHNHNATSDTFVSELGDDYSDNHNEILDKSSTLGFNIFDNTCKPPPVIFESSIALEKILATNLEAKVTLSPTINNDRVPRKTVTSSSKGIQIIIFIISLSFLLTLITS